MIPLWIKNFKNSSLAYSNQSSRFYGQIGWIGFLGLPTVRSANDMGVYYHPEQPAIVPDGFLSLGVERFYDEELRPSYVLWEEQIVPSLVLEVVSITPSREYTSKLVREAFPLGNEYARMGVSYYVIYNSKRRRKPKLEIHKLVNGRYELQDSNPLWMPEIGLGIGYERGEYCGITRDWLYRYTETNERYPTPSEQIDRVD
jgi:Uma2 family endonuclease